MTGPAWVMLGATWAVIGYFTLRFFLKVLNAPPDRRDEGVPPVTPP